MGDNGRETQSRETVTNDTTRERGEWSAKKKSGTAIHRLRVALGLSTRKNKVSSGDVVPRNSFAADGNTTVSLTCRLEPRAYSLAARMLYAASEQKNGGHTTGIQVGAG